MALIKSFTDNAGTQHQKGYWRVLRINLHREGGSYVQVALYHSKSQRQDEKSPVLVKRYALTNEEVQEWFVLQRNPLRSAYLYLASLEDFEGAEEDADANE